VTTAAVAELYAIRMSDVDITRYQVTFKEATRMVRYGLCVVTWYRRSFPQQFGHSESCEILLGKLYCLFHNAYDKWGKHF